MSFIKIVAHPGGRTVFDFGTEENYQKEMGDLISSLYRSRFDFGTEENYQKEMEDFISSLYRSRLVDDIVGDWGRYLKEKYEVKERDQ